MSCFSFGEVDFDLEGFLDVEVGVWPSSTSTKPGVRGFWWEGWGLWKGWERLGLKVLGGMVEGVGV